jgi:hypothetical protein
MDVSGPQGKDDAHDEGGAFQHDGNKGGMSYPEQYAYKVKL